MTFGFHLAGYEKLLQATLLYLSELSARQLVYNEYLVRCDFDISVLLKMSLNICDVDRAFCNNGDPNLLEVGLVHDCARRGLFNRRQRFENFFDLGRGNLMATAVDDISATPCQVQDTLRIDGADVAGVEPLIFCI